MNLNSLFLQQSLHFFTIPLDHTEDKVARSQQSFINHLLGLHVTTGYTDDSVNMKPQCA